MEPINPYYDPEGCGLTTIGEIDDSGSYEFNILVAWKSLDGKVWYGQDSGCSCPTPFEGSFYRGSDDTNLERLTSQNFLDLEGLAKKWNVDLAERQNFLDKVRAAL